MFNISLSKISISDLKKYTKFIIIFIVILFFVGGYFLLWPKYQEFRKNSIDLDIESGKIKKKKDYIIELENNLAIISDYEQEILKVSSAIPLQYSVSSLFSLVQKTASENGLIINAVDFSPVASDKQSDTGIDKIMVSATIRGGYSSFNGFISSLFKNSRMVEIISIKMESSESTEPEEEGLADSFDFLIELEANYYEKEE